MIHKISFNLTNESNFPLYSILLFVILTTSVMVFEKLSKAFLKEKFPALAEWLSSRHQKIAGLIPNQSTYLGCQFNPQSKAYKKQSIDFFPSQFSLSLPASRTPSLPPSLSLFLPLSLKSIKKISLGEGRKEGKEEE